ncbi:hypothetical protein T07_3471 [Trichinella nelsoni]|uniref:Uncharacterized protein n=1 Tax=Trichinella nelsoni TaxID=6336 RepID=A0A0V0RK88_9BILA|nr:hypothetical protein T07_3471 [Trichinella nelsoni]
MLEILIAPRPAPSLYIKDVTRSLLVVWECCIAQGVLIAPGMYNMTACVIWLADESVRRTLLRRANLIDSSFQIKPSINQFGVNGKYAVDICSKIDALVCGCDVGSAIVNWIVVMCFFLMLFDTHMHREGENEWGKLSVYVHI